MLKTIILKSFFYLFSDPETAPDNSIMPQPIKDGLFFLSNIIFNTFFNFFRTKEIKLARRKRLILDNVDKTLRERSLAAEIARKVLIFCEI